MKFKDIMPWLVVGGAGFWLYNSGYLDELLGQMSGAAVLPPDEGPPLGPPANGGNGGPVFPPPAPPPVFPPPAPPAPPPVAAPPLTPPPLASAPGAAERLVAAGGAAPKNVWEWGYYVDQLKLNVPRRDPWGVLGNSVPDIQAVRMTAPEYVAYLNARDLAGLGALACACLARSTRI